MKRTLISLALCLAAALPSPAQDVSYALPVTTLSINVEVSQESFFAGPYAAYAHQMLSMDVEEEDRVTCSLTHVEIVPRVEADPSAWYSCDPENAALLALSAQGLVAFRDKEEASQLQWRFLPGLKADFSRRGLTEPEKQVTRIEYKPVVTDTAIINIPIEHKILVEKTLEDKATDAADMILAVRKDRLNIATGNTDATYSGEALGAAIQELDRIEQEYLSLFRGYSVKRTLKVSFDVTPSPSARVQRYLVFRLTDDGPVSGGVKGVPYYLELEPEEAEIPDDNSDRKKTKTTAVRYRIPQVCKVRLTEDGHTLLETRLPFYQLGKEGSLSLSK